MKPQRKLVAERIAAQHCPELVRTAPGPDELVPLLERAGERFARAFGPALAPLIGGKGPQVKAPRPKRTTLDELTMFSPALAANSLLGVGPDSLPLLVSLDAAAVLRMVDRTFGGRGEAPSPLPDAFPVSAELLIVRIEALLIEHLGAALSAGRPGAMAPLRRGGSLAVLEPFAADEPLIAIEFELTEPSGENWLATLAVPLPTLCALFGAAQRPAAPQRRGPGDPLAEPFASLPLELAAVLVDMRMSMAVLAAIEPGTILPVAVARAVPLRLGDTIVATGTVGAADDRVALQITHAF